MNYGAQVVVLIEIYAMLAVSLSLLVRLTGLLALAQITFYGIGAYASALLSMRLGVPVLLSFPLGAVIAGMVAYVTAIPAARLRGDTFVLASMSVQTVTLLVLQNAVVVTRGPLGLPGIPPPRIGPWALTEPAPYLLLTTPLCAVVCIGIARLAGGQRGRYLRAIREDEVWAETVGVDTISLKRRVLFIAGVLAGLAGAAYAHFIRYIDPTSFTLSEAIVLLAMVAVGGSNPWLGPVIGAAFFGVLPEALRFLGLPTAAAANIRQIIFSVLLLGTVLYRPAGLFRASRD